MTPGSPVWMPHAGALAKASLVEVHGPVSRVSRWDGKKNTTLEVRTADLLPYVEGEPPAISIALQISAIKRELELRKNVYAKRVTDQRMTQDAADYQLAVMGAVLATLEGAKQ